jgi:hypothetical protein
MEYLMRPQHANAAKLDAELRVAIDDELKSELAALAVMSGRPLAEYVRDVLSIHVRGSLTYMRSRMAGPEQRRE